MAHIFLIKISLFLMLSALCFGAYGCASKISQADFLGEDEAATASRSVVIDVRGKGAYEKGHIPGAINISVLALPFKMDDIPAADKKTAIVVYCAHGPRVGLAGFFLRVAGYENVFHLADDMAGWRKNDLPLEMSPGKE